MSNIFGTLMELLGWQHNDEKHCWEIYDNGKILAWISDEVIGELGVTADKFAQEQEAGKRYRQASLWEDNPWVWKPVDGKERRADC